MASVINYYFRENCHLCESMRSELVLFSQKHPVQWNEFDIDKDIELIRRFDVEVPVLTVDDQVICYHFFDEKEFRSALLIAE